MSLLNQFMIDIGKLAVGRYDYSFKISKEFFELFDYSLVDQGDLSVELQLEKKTSFVALNYTINGTVELVCDRSLDTYDHQINTEKKVILKYGEEEQELTEEIEVIPFNTQKIDVSRHIYEFISVSVPMKKLHPRYLNESPDDQIIYSSSDDEEEEDQVLDPRWSELKKLKKK